METGPYVDIHQLYDEVQHNFPKIKQSNCEIGTCKKVYQLPNNLGLAVTHGNSLTEKELIHNEHVYLSYLKDQGYPVVNFHGAVFPVESGENRTRYGYLMDYISHAVFVEAKTPALIKAQIFAALLGIPTLAREAWWGLHNKSLTEEICRQLKNPRNLPSIQESAGVLFENFKKLINKLHEDNLAIADLQIMLSQDGGLTIIDPLDVVKIDPEMKTVISVIHPQRKPASGFIPFLLQTNQWLERAASICHTIKTIDNPEMLQSYAKEAHSTRYVKPFIITRAADSEVNDDQPSHSSDPNVTTSASKKPRDIL